MFASGADRDGAGVARAVEAAAVFCCASALGRCTTKRVLIMAWRSTGARRIKVPVVVGTACKSWFSDEHQVAKVTAPLPSKLNSPSQRAMITAARQFPMTFTVV